MIRPFRIALASLILALIVSACGEKAPSETPLTIQEDASTLNSRVKEVMENTSFELYEGIEVTLWATDSLAPDPIGMSIDDDGNVYLTRTNRQKNSEFDIRGHQNWEIASISLQSVEDRRYFLHETFAPEKSGENEWLPDLNNDGSHDWKDLAVEKDEVWKITDTDGDGLADVSKRILADFDDEVADVAGALLVRDNDVFVGIGPDMWRMQDTNGDEVLDKKESISHGYAVHIGFGGHGMSGAIEGPDGRIYWGIGDIGANLTDQEGNQYMYPNQGVIVRSDPDGSNFEVFAAGLRNTHEFVFDEYGNIISADNDGDHPGESERLVYIVQGHDAGWRSNWQYGKYNDPKNNKYKVWMDEKLYLPRWEGQAAYIIPPIMNYHNGPAGMVYNPGTALGSDWKNHFFVVEVVGNPSRSPLWAFTLKPSGASFELEQEKKVITGILPTGIKFGPDGALYAADWINGWDTKNYGRVWRIDVTNDKNDLVAQRKQTEAYMKLDYADQSDDRLYELLFYEDMRIRQKAQFALADRGGDGLEQFSRALEQTDNQLARVHGIWGIGQLARKNVENAELLLPFLDDADEEIVAQVVKTLGDVRFENSAESLLPLLGHSNKRVQFFAAEALGRMEYAAAVDPILAMLRANNDEDIYLRHAGVLALSRIGDKAAITSLENDDERAMRIAAVLVLRRMGDEGVALFLDDPDEYIVTEAARAIDDDFSIEPALPALAAVLSEDRFSSEPLLRRAINAALRVGGEKELDLLIDFARREGVPAALKAEALATLGTWASPSVLDRVDGRFRGKVSRDPSEVRVKVAAVASEFWNSMNPEVTVAAIEMLGNLEIADYNEQLAEMMKGNTEAMVRAAALTGLSNLDYPDMESMMRRGMNDTDAGVRTAALGLMENIDISAENLPGIVEPVFAKGTLDEQQEMLRVLGQMPAEKSEPVLSSLLDRLKSGSIDRNLTLDMIEAVEATGSESLIAGLAPLQTEEAQMTAALYGGDRRQGARLFYTHPAAQCTRCHAIRGDGTEVGPSLAGIANVLSREQLLEALINPSARLAPGYGTVMLTLKDGQNVNGIFMEETETELILKTSEAEPLHIEKARISERRNAPSSMPPMGSLLTTREIRDLVEFLANLD